MYKSNILSDEVEDGIAACAEAQAAIWLAAAKEEASGRNNFIESIFCKTLMNNQLIRIIYRVYNRVNGIDTDVQE